MFSVWNQGKRSWDYYENGEPDARANAPVPKHTKTERLGMTPDELAWPLPANARYVGTGPNARGRVAVRKGLGSLSGFAGADSIASLAFLGVASGALIWWARSK